MRTYSNENDFDIHENGREGGTHFHMNGFARRLVLKERKIFLYKLVQVLSINKFVAWPRHRRLKCPILDLLR